MERIDVGRGHLAADVFGPADAPPVLLIAGGGADAATWVRLVPEVGRDAADQVRSEPIDRPLATDHRVAVFDQAGIGRSVAVDPAMSGADYAADALAVGRALLGSRFVVVGMSLGGIAAQHLVMAGPDAVNGLVLVATIAGAAAFIGPTPHDVPADRRSFASQFPDTHPALFAHLTRRTADLPYHPDGDLAQIAIFLSHDPGDDLAGVRCPTWVLGGREDRTFPVENTRRLATAIPGARLVDLERVGHAVHHEAPEAIAGAIRAITATG